MKALNVSFLNTVITKYYNKECIIHITDTTSKIIASSDKERIGTVSSTAIYINKVQRATSMANPDSSKDTYSSVYGVPVLADDEIYGTVIVRGPANTAVHIGETIKTAIETIIEYDSHTYSDAHHKDLMSHLASKLLSGGMDREEIYSSMYRLDMDPELLRCVIYINLNYHQNNYFNVKLNLGYISGIEQLKANLMERLNSNPYLNSQDIVYMHDYNTAIIIKSFIPVTDISRIYLSLDKICASIVEICSSFKSFSFNMACGSLYSDVMDIQKSFNEAEDLIKIGIKSKKDESFFMPENILFESICYYMHPQITNKIILSTISKLTKKDGSIAKDIIDCAEAYVDSCMNISETAAKTFLHRNTINSRLERLYMMTGLRPAKSFGDAFIIKETAVYIRQNDLENIKGKGRS